MRYETYSDKICLNIFKFPEGMIFKKNPGRKKFRKVCTFIKMFSVVDLNGHVSPKIQIKELTLSMKNAFAKLWNIFLTLKN